MTYTDLRVRAGSKRWHALRDTGIGASEIAAVVGLSPYLSATTLYHRKRHEIPDAMDNARMEWGRRLERMIFERWLEDHPDVRHIWGKMYRSDERPWQLATPDGLAWLDSDVCRPRPPVVVEVKTAASKDEWGDSGTDEIPIHYRCQVLQQMDVVGADLAYVPCLFNGREYREYLVRYDADDARILRAKGSAFWDMILAGDPPPVDAHTSTAATLRRLWGVEPSKEALIPTDLAAKYQRALNVKSQIDALVGKYDAEVRRHVGDAQRAYADGRVVATRSAWTQKQLDTTRLREDHPDLWAQYAKDSPRQRFNWKGL